jgi:hypothetical protein
MRDTRSLFDPPSRGRFGDNEEIRGNDSVRSDLLDLEVVLHHGTEKAVLVSLDGKESSAKWLPRSLIEIEVHARYVKGELRNGRLVDCAIATVTLRERLAKEKGLI